MGRGDRYQQKSFAVPMPGADVKWPLPKKAEVVDASSVCRECGKNVAPGLAHTDLRDAGRPRQRVCFGKVIAR